MTPEIREHMRNDVVMAAIALVVSIAVVVIAATTIELPTTVYGSDAIGPKGFAYVVGGLTAILSAALLVILIMKYRAAVASGEPVEDAAEFMEYSGDDPRFPVSKVRPFLIIALSVLYVLILPPVGYIPATLVMALVALWIMNERSPRILIAHPIIYTFASFAVFDLLLHVRLPRGILTVPLRQMGL